MSNSQNPSEPTKELSGSSGDVRQPKDRALDPTSDFVVGQETPLDGPKPGKENKTPQNDPPDPQSIDRFRILKRLGKGGFATVYLAQDSDLDRQVALKVPRLERFEDQSDLELFVEEARKVAQLEHPGIVRVLDVQRRPDLVYIVLPYLSGGDLSQFARYSRLPLRRIAELMIAIADAVGFAHQRGYYHLDLKPSNILLDNSGNPCVADFGMALHESRQGDRSGQIFGTYPYMSPDQTRGEAHRLDGRSDIWSLGVILYELLTGRLPFSGSTADEIFSQIRHDDPKPPRQIDPEIPKELSRICLVCLAKRSRDRYPAAADLREDLLAWLRESAPANESESTVHSRRTSPVGEDVSPSPTPVMVHRNNQPESDSESSGEIKLVPQGLRSFGPEHAGFYLSLLPGPHDRDGLPRGVRFWKTRIEQTDADKTFPVGLVYGPSGCGKSSMVKAGLLSRLAPHVLPIYFEATGSDTETRLLKALRKHCPVLPRVNDLPALFLQLRTDGGSGGRKVVIVIDQFEQWLHARGSGENHPLVDAFRQCDGVGVQVIVMVRDDFWMSATRFMQSLEIDLLENENSAAVDLFDRDHAIRVLGAFGQAYGRLPEHREEWSDSQRAFLRQAVDGLAEDGRIVCVRLSLFAEMMKDRPWNPESLSEVGGTEGVGVTFLEESFGSRTAPPAHRYHQKGVRAILAALLPGEGTDIKGQMQSYGALREASGYAQRPADFDAVLRILDSQMRLITPTDPEGDSLDDAARSSSLSTRSYQLTHDFLVPSLRQWLTSKQRETKRGRAELKLAERAAIWSTKPENKQLPSFIEWLQIRRWTESSKWRSLETRVMQQADRYHTVRAGMIASTLLLLTAVGWGVKRWNDQQRLDSSAESLVVTLQKAAYANVADELSKLAPIRSVVDPKLQNALAASTPDSDEHLKLSLALLPTDPSQLDTLVPRLQSADTTYVRLLIDQLRPNRETIVEPLWTMIEESSGNASCLPVASALADYAPEDPRWAGIAARVTDQLVRENSLRVSTWIDLLRPAAKHLNPELQSVYAASLGDRTQTQIDLATEMATEILEIYASSDFSTLHELILTGQPTQFSRLFDEYTTFKKEAIAELRLEVARSFESDPKASDEENEAARIVHTERQANAAVALMRLEDPRPVYEFLTVDRDPEGLSQFIHRIRGREVSPSLLVRSFNELRALPTPADPLLRRQHEFRIYGMLLGLGWFAVDELPTAERDRLVEDLGGMYASHPSRAVHSALGWLLRQWGEEEAVRKVDETPVDYDPSGEREWYVVKVRPPEVEVQTSETDETDQTSLRSPDSPPPIFFTMVVFPGDEYLMGERGDQQMVEVAGPIAVSDREVTWRQFSPIDGDSHRQSWEQQRQRDLQGRRLLDDEPVFGVSWFDAVNYCRWLTSAYLPGEEFQCYSQKEFTADQVPEPGWINLSASEDWPMDASRPGFRLMTEAEWEYVARSGMETEYSFGTSEGLLDDYGWYDENSEGWSHRTGVKRPSVSGLFDIHGNLWEWTNDLESSDRVIRGGSWGDWASICRSAYRDWCAPSNRSSYLGFRLLLSSVGQVQPAEPEQAE